MVRRFPGLRAGKLHCLGGYVKSSRGLGKGKLPFPVIPSEGEESSKLNERSAIFLAVTFRRCNVLRVQTQFMPTATFRVWRGNQDGGEFRDYQTEVYEGMVVLDAV